MGQGKKRQEAQNGETCLLQRVVGGGCWCQEKNVGDPSNDHVMIATEALSKKYRRQKTGHCGDGMLCKRYNVDAQLPLSDRHLGKGGTGGKIGRDTVTGEPGFSTRGGGKGC